MRSDLLKKVASIKTSKKNNWAFSINAAGTERKSLRRFLVIKLAGYVVVTAFLSTSTGRGRYM
jgi:hypothetical protein